MINHFFVTTMATTRTYQCYRYLSYLSYKYAVFREGDRYDKQYLNELFHNNRSWHKFRTVRITSTLPIWDTEIETEMLNDILQIKKFWLAT